MIFSYLWRYLRGRYQVGTVVDPVVAVAVSASPTALLLHFPAYDANPPIYGTKSLDLHQPRPRAPPVAADIPDRNYARAPTAEDRWAPWARASPSTGRRTAAAGRIRDWTGGCSPRLAVAASTGGVIDDLDGLESRQKDPLHVARGAVDAQ